MTGLKQFYTSLQQPSKQKWRILLMLLALIMLLLTISRIWSAIELSRQTQQALIPNVEIIRATQLAYRQHIVLPGNIQAWHEAPIYARTNGYLKTWYVDIGYSVKKGDILAIIETPELDAQLRQAEADLNVMIAKSKLANITAKRWQHLVKSDSVSQQATDEKTHQRDALAASVIAARANRDRLKELVGFEQVIAPFNGIITARGTDIGDLINAGSHPAAKPLFRIVQSDLLRLYVKIPEVYGSRIKPDTEVELTLAEYPGQRFKARLLKTADAINPITRTLLAEFVISNKQHVLLPGSYSQVDLLIPPQNKSIVLPVNTLLFRAQGLQVAMIDEHNQVRLKNIRVAVDYGAYVELSDGVQPMDKIVLNPSDAIYEGQKVHVTHNKTHSDDLFGEKKSLASSKH